MKRRAENVKALHSSVYRQRTLYNAVCTSLYISFSFLAGGPLYFFLPLATPTFVVPAAPTGGNINFDHLSHQKNKNEKGRKIFKKKRVFENIEQGGMKNKSNTSRSFVISLLNIVYYDFFFMLFCLLFFVFFVDTFSVIFKFLKSDKIQMKRNLSNWQHNCTLCLLHRLAIIEK